MTAQMRIRTDQHARKCLENWIITVESTEEQHQEIILSTIAKRAHQIFEERGRKNAFELDDWLTAEQELCRDEFDGNTSGFQVLVDCPQDPDVTTILSLTAHSLVVFRRRTRHAGEANAGPDVQSVHLFAKELDPVQADVKAADGILHVCVPKKIHTTLR
jgi:Protein of unknown function (DUF2934)